eukprot:jgi/Chrzof1/4704/Cz14g23140.t1
MQACRIRRTLPGSFPCHQPHSLRSSKLKAGQLAVDMGLDKRVGFMGAGQMAEALARGLMHKGVLKPAQICCTDPVNNRKELFKSFGATPYDTNLEVAQNSDVLIVAVKPQYAKQQQPCV